MKLFCLNSFVSRLLGASAESADTAKKIKISKDYLEVGFMSIMSPSCYIYTYIKMYTCLGTS